MYFLIFLLFTNIRDILLSLYIFNNNRLFLLLSINFQGIFLHLSANINHVFLVLLRIVRTTLLLC